MGFLFLNSEKEINELAKCIFKILDISTPEKRFSENVFQGEYYKISFLGVQVSLEYNSYDYEEEYNYMMNIDRDIQSNLELQINETDCLTRLVLKAIRLNTTFQIAIEDNGNLVIIN